MKKTKLFSILTLAAATLVTSCGGSEPEQQTIKIPFWHTFGKTIQVELERQCDTFENYINERDGVKIDIEPQYQGGYNDLVDKMGKGYAIGETPTISVAYPDHVATYLTYGDDFVCNLDSYFDDPKLGFKADETLNPGLKGIEDFVPAFVEEGQEYIKEGTYSLPLMKSSEVMLYNKPIVTQALSGMGIETGVETYMNNITWDQFFDLANYVNEHESELGMFTQDNDAYPVYYDSDSNLFISQCYQREIPFISTKDGQGQIDFNNQKAKDLVKELNDLHTQKVLTTKGANEGRYGSDWFKAKKSAFVVGSSGGTGYSDPGVSFEVGVCKFPTYKTADAEHSKYISQGVTLTLLNNKKDSAEINTEKTKYGWEFMKFLTNTENNISIALSSEGYIPVRNSCYESPEYNEYINEAEYMSKVAKTVIEDINGNYLNYPVFKGTDKIRDQVGGIITQTLLGKKDIEKAFNDAEAESKKYL